MAFFKFSKAGDDSPAARRPPESIEVMRKRARHRLIGAGVLVLAAVVGFPVLFDTQPRPIAVDIPIEIPDRNKVKPLPVPAQPATQAPVVSGPVTVAPTPVAPEKAPPPEKVAVAPPSAPAAAPAEAPPPAPPEAKPQTERAPKPLATPAAKSDDGTKAKALLEDKPVQVAAASDAGRFVVQVGAFADVSKANAARRKLDRAGLKTYTNVAETKDGKRVRVRVGPFANRAEADKAAAKIKGLDLPAAILTL
jgi:DedD protein